MNERYDHHSYEEMLKQLKGRVQKGASFAFLAYLFVFSDLPKCLHVT